MWDAVSAVGCVGADSWDSTEVGKVGVPATAGDCFAEFEAPDFVEFLSGSDGTSECVGLFMGSLAITLFNFSYRRNAIFPGFFWDIGSSQYKYVIFYVSAHPIPWPSQSRAGEPQWDQ